MEREQAAYEESRRVFVEEELPLLDTRIVETLQLTHPTGEVTVGVVFVDPLAVPDIKAFIEELGGVWLSAWRTDYVCSPAPGGQAPELVARWLTREAPKTISPRTLTMVRLMVPHTLDPPA